MVRKKSRRYKKSATIAMSALRAAFIKKLQDDASIDWDFKMFGPRSLTLDVLYLLAVSISSEYAQYSGFKKFLDDVGVSVDLRMTPYEGAGK